jgi:RNAse (barnase) inhibitor barstar
VNDDFDDDDYGVTSTNDVNEGWVDLHALLPGLRGNIIHTLNSEDERVLCDRLAGVGYRVRVLDGAQIRDERAFFERACAALDLPPHFGENWDAFNDSLWNVSGAWAVVWRDVDLSLAADAQTVFSAMLGLADAALEPARDPGEPMLKLVLFLLGSGPGYGRLTG